MLPCQAAGMLSLHHLLLTISSKNPLAASAGGWPASHRKFQWQLAHANGRVPRLGQQSHSCPCPWSRLRACLAHAQLSQQVQQQSAATTCCPKHLASYPTCSLLAGCQRARAQVGGCSSSGAGAQRHAVPRALDGHSRPRPQERCLDPGAVMSGPVSDSSAHGPHELAALVASCMGPGGQRGLSPLNGLCLLACASSHAKDGRVKAGTVCGPGSEHSHALSASTRESQPAESCVM